MWDAGNKEVKMISYSRRKFFTKLGVCGASFLFSGAGQLSAKSHHNGASKKLPNIILCMADDQGWGDTAYNGHPVLKTSNLDDMAEKGIRFNRFYAAAPVCSPTRGSCLTGRNPFRYGIYWAHVGGMRKPEITIAEALKTRGYRTGHFGKWHLGFLMPERHMEDGLGIYSPPWENGFDEAFSTKSAMPTWDPQHTPDDWLGFSNKNELHKNAGKPWTSSFYVHNGKKVTEQLTGDDSRIIMDRAIPFIQNAARENVPFLAVIWFHTPHRPVVAGEKYRKMYPNCTPDEQHYYGAITAMDEQIGRLRAELRRLGIEKQTMLWYCSDNGAEVGWPRNRGSNKPFRGHKATLYEGGIRVPALLEWPEQITSGRVTDVICCTSDYFPTILDISGIAPAPDKRPVDGVSLVPLIKGEMKQRPAPIGFEARKKGKFMVALIDNRYKLCKPVRDRDDFELYDLIGDPYETKDLAAVKPDIVSRMRKTLEEWRDACKASEKGLEYKE